VFWQRSLEYRDAFKREFGSDPWVARPRDADSSKISEIERDAEHTATVIKAVLDASQDDESFRINMLSAMRDDPSMVMRLRSKAASNKH
jgi:hypothetical protein